MIDIPRMIKQEKKERKIDIAIACLWFAFVLVAKRMDLDWPFLVLGSFGIGQRVQAALGRSRIILFMDTIQRYEAVVECLLTRDDGAQLGPGIQGANDDVEAVSDGDLAQLNQLTPKKDRS